MIMKYAYWVITVLLCALLCFSAGMYIVKYSDVTSEFIKMGFPTWIIYPLAVCKLAAVAVLLIRKNKPLVEWAYAGLFFNIMLALGAHVTIADGEQWGALVALLLLLSSYFFGRKVRPVV